MKVDLRKINKKIDSFLIDSKNTEFVQHICNYFFKIMEYLLILSTIKFIQIKTKDVFFEILFYVGLVLTYFSITKIIIDYYDNRIKEIPEPKLSKKEKEKLDKLFRKQFIFHRFLGGVTGIIMSTLTFILIKKMVSGLLITF